MLHVAQAWKDGAHLLGKACDKCDDMTAEQLRERLLRGDYDLIGVGAEKPEGWAAVSVQEGKGNRWLYVHAIHAPGAAGMASMEQLKAYAEHNECRSIRGFCQPAVARLWTKRFDARPLQTMMEIEVSR